MSAQPTGGSAAPVLRVTHSDGTRDFATGPVTVGRERTADVMVAHEDVSRRHLQFRLEAGVWYLFDLGSTNGTFVGGSRVSRQPITAPTEVRVGGLQAPTLRVEVVPAASAPPRGPAAPAAAPSGPRSGPPSGPPSGPLSGPPSGPSGPGSSGPRLPPQAPPRSSPHEPPSQPRQAPAAYGGSYASGDNSPAPQAPPGQLAHGLTVLPEQQSVGQVLTIGRTRANDVVLDDPLVSRQHATLQLGSPAVLRDLNSFNGTYVNGRRVQGSVQLRPGDEVIVGNQTFTWDGRQLASRATRRDLTLFAQNLSKVVKGDKRLLDDMSFSLGPSSLTAVVGPSGSGKSTLLGALTGLNPASHGNVVWGGHDLYTHYDQLRFQIGLVPQQDIQHPQLTVRQGLQYAAELRLPPDTTKAERDQRVQHVVGQMQLERQIDNRIGTQLSGGQMKRVSIATELLTAPPLLFLDEPTSGLDPGLDRDVMHQLRSLADEGRVVVVVTHSVLALDVCDNVVVLAPGGRLAYFGPPAGVLEHFGCPDYPAVFDMLDDPDLWQRIQPPRSSMGAAALPAANAPVAPPPQESMLRQFSTLTRRNLAVVLSDRLLLGMLLLMPLLLGGLSRIVQGDHGLSSIGEIVNGKAEYYATPELTQRLTILVVAAALMGTAITIRELVKERPIFQREYAVGLSPDMYLLSKIVVLGIAAWLQGVAVTFLATVGMQGPNGDGVLGLGWLEVGLAIGALGFSMAVVGLAVSALVTSSEQTMPVLVGLVMIQLVLSGAIVEVNDRFPLEQFAWLAPARWAFVAAGVSTDLDAAPRLRGDVLDPLLTNSGGQWFADMIALGVLTLLALGIGFWLVRRSATRR